MVHKKDPLTSCLSYVLRLYWLNAIEVVKKQWNDIATSFIQKLEQCFVAQDIMNATKLSYP